MILFDLRCKDGHAFEAWFRDGAAYEDQAAAGDLACPVCGSVEVTKALMAPALNSRPKVDAEKAAEAMRLWRRVQSHIEKNFDHVGPKFAEEARKIHYGETDARGIYGETSDDEAKALTDEGIEVARVPWLPRENS